MKLMSTSVRGCCKGFALYNRDDRPMLIMQIGLGHAVAQIGQRQFVHEWNPFSTNPFHRLVRYVFVRGMMRRLRANLKARRPLK